MAAAIMSAPVELFTEKRQLDDRAMYKGLLILVPTRNRSDLAINAIRSITASSSKEVYVLVSDNSTESTQVESLSSFCQQLGYQQLEYITPPHPKPMSDHWSWAFRYALDNYDVNHFLVLTDRMVFKRDGLGDLLEQIRKNPAQIISFNTDMIVDAGQSIRVRQYQWSNALLDIDSSHLTYLVSEGILQNCLPRLLNSVVSRNIVDSVYLRYGSLFESTAPDFNFCFKCLDFLDYITYYDKSLLIQYSLNRSNGNSMAKGVMTKDYNDFLSNIGDKPLNYAAPVSGVSTIYNTIIHEYCMVKQVSDRHKFPEVNIDAYFETIYREIVAMEQVDLRQKNLKLLQEGKAKYRHMPPLRRFIYKIRRNILNGTLINILLQVALTKLPRFWAGPKTKGFWMTLYERCNVNPPADNDFEFATLEDAFQYLDNFPRRRSSNIRHLAIITKYPWRRSA